MFKNRVVSSLKNVIGWADHWDTSTIPTLPPALTNSESGETYQSFLPSLVRLDYIQASLPSNRNLEEYLDTVETEAITSVLNRLVEAKQLGNNGKDIINNTIIYQNRIRGNKVVNQGRFVGIEIDLKNTMNIEVAINRIGLYLDDDDIDIEIFLFNSLQDNYVASYIIPTLSGNSFTWFSDFVETMASNNGSDTDGGVWYIGYYQDNLSSQAIQLSSFNWKNGYCGGCNKKSVVDGYRTVSKYVSMTPFYISSTDLPAQGVLFDPNDIVYVYDNNFGLNFNVSVKCDISQYLIDNRSSLKKIIGMQVAYNVLQTLVASSQVSAIEQNIQPLALRKLEGATETKQRPFMETIDRAIKAVILDSGNNNQNPCLPCAKKGIRVTHG